MSARRLNDESAAGRWVNYLAVTRSILHNKHAAQPMKVESYPFCTAKSMGFGRFARCGAITGILKGLKMGRRWPGPALINSWGCCFGAADSLLFGWVADTAS